MITCSQELDFRRTGQEKKRTRIAFSFFSIWKFGRLVLKFFTENAPEHRSCKIQSLKYSKQLGVT